MSQPVYTSLMAGARFIRDTSFPHQVARSLSLAYGLKVARFKPQVGKQRQSPLAGLKPQQAELVQQAEQYGAFILTRTQAFAGIPQALIFPQEIPNEELLQLVVAEIRRSGLL